MEVDKIRKYLRDKPLFLSCLLLVLNGILQILFGNIIPQCNGYGFDGCLYGEITENFYEKVFVEKLNPYYIQRMLPFGLMHYTLRVLQVPLEPYYIIKAFQIYNVLLFLVINLIWFRIAQIYHFRNQLFWLGYIFIFTNLIAGRTAFYYPVLTDYTAYLLGFALLYFYLKNNLLGIMIISFLGAFTWASFIYFSFILILFPIESKNYLAEYKDNSKINYWFVIIVPLIYFLFIALHIEGDVIYWSSGVYETVVKGNFYIFYISALINTILLMLFFRYFIPTFMEIWKITVNSILKLSFIRVLATLFLYSLIFFILKWVSSTEEQHLNPYKIHGYILFNSIQSPLLFIIEGVTSLGIVYIILILYFKRIFQQVILKFGLGFYLTFLIFFAFKLIPESRLIINYLPIIIFLVCYLLNTFFISTKSFWLIVAFSFVFSKIYLSFLTNEVIVANEVSTGFFENFFVNQLNLSKNVYFSIKLLVFVMILFFTAYLTTKLNRHFYSTLKNE